VCGIASFDEDSVAVLTYVQEWVDEEDGAATCSVACPEIQIRDRLAGDLLHTPDFLPIEGYEHNDVGDYSMQTTYSLPARLGAHRSWRRSDWVAQKAPANVASAAMMRGEPPMMYVVTPKEIIVVNVRDLDDQVTSALQEHRFKDALDIARSNKRLLRHNQLPDLVHKYLEDLMHLGSYDRAAAECPTLLEDDATLWEFWILRFMRDEQLQALARHIPVEKPRLAPGIYELVLHHFLSSNPQAFLDTIKQWGNPGEPELYSLTLLLELIRNKNKEDHGREQPLLVEAQAQLYVMADPPEYEKALACYLCLEGARVCDPQQVLT
jgi:tetratricopeptide (TPR) repeat protein